MVVVVTARKSLFDLVCDRSFRHDRHGGLLLSDLSIVRVFLELADERGTDDADVRWLAALAAAQLEVVKLGLLPGGEYGWRLGPAARFLELARS